MCKTKTYQRRHSRWYESLVLSFPFQVLFGLFVVVFLPSWERWGWEFWLHLPSVRTNTIWACTISFIVISFTLRRLIRFPGAQVSAYIFPTVAIIYLIAIAALFFTRVEYTRQVLFTSFVASLLWFYTAFFIGRRYRRLKFALVPVGKHSEMSATPLIELRRLSDPDLEGVRYDGVVADLYSSELGPEWGRFLAKCILSHLPVYHIARVQESITGKVEITHLSENDYGALLPSGIYNAFKRCVDFFAALLLLPLLVLPMLLIGWMIRRDSPGPALFIQSRMGYRGRPFKVIKFRTMYCDLQGLGFTEGQNDPRITPVGRVLRKYRIDELPQIFNVLKGEMSFIGPRPESMQLSEWYERDVPFFSYRHVVRPGISGWAQVEQGYAAEVDGMIEKLQYDFYYIKHFSLWLDVLIVFKTLKTIFTGYGAR